MRNTLPYTTKKGRLTKSITFTLSPKERDTLFKSNTAAVAVRSRVQTKLLSPVDLDKANAIFDAQVHSKKLKGYSEGAGASALCG